MELSAFEVLGPIMIGPSSSHTAGACKIANVGRKICSGNVEEVEFVLHGSFACTYKGHGTDKALVGGTLGMLPDDSNIQFAFEEAEKRGLNYKITTGDLGEKYHPNSVKIIYHKNNEEEDEYIIGSSVGGGAIMIVNINGIDIDFRGLFPTLLLQYEEQSGIIAYVSNILFGNGYSIESINTKKNPLTNIVTLTVETDKKLSSYVKSTILGAERFMTAKYVEV